MFCWCFDHPLPRQCNRHLPRPCQSFPPENRKDHKDRAHIFNFHTFKDDTFWCVCTPYLPSSLGPGCNKISASLWSVRIAGVPEAVDAHEEKPCLTILVLIHRLPMAVFSWYPGILTKHCFLVRRHRCIWICVGD